jgi:ABC-type phosphate transport system auxiliary subunit
MGEENRFRKKMIHIKLSDDEYNTIWQKSLASNLTVSDAIRTLIVFGRIKPDSLDEKSQALVDNLNKLIERTITEINHIGNNINQIAYNTNSVYNTELIDLKMANDNLLSAYMIFLDSINEIRELCEYET